MLENTEPLEVYMTPGSPDGGSPGNNRVQGRFVTSCWQVKILLPLISVCECALTSIFRVNSPCSGNELEPMADYLLRSLAPRDLPNTPSCHG